MDIGSIALNASKISFAELIILVGVLYGFGLVLGLIEHKTLEYMSNVFGRVGISITAIIGTPVHEIGHLIMCILFGHKVTNVKLLNLSKSSTSLGSVSHTFNYKNPYQRIGNFFIGIGPIISGVMSIVFLLWLFVPQAFGIFKTIVLNAGQQGGLYGVNQSLFISFQGLIGVVFNMSNAGTITFWIFLFLTLCISVHVSLSKEDLNSVYDGVVFLFILLFVINSIAGYLSFNTMGVAKMVSVYNTYLIVFLLLISIFAITSFIIMWIASQFKSIIDSER